MVSFRPGQTIRQIGARRGGFNTVAAIVAVFGVFGLGVASAAAETTRILALGTSLTAGYGLPEVDAFTGQLEAALRDQGYDVEVLNAGVSGDTTAGGLSRLDWSLADDPDFAIVELGSNDGLRGIDPDTTRENLDAILARLSAAGIPTLFTGMYAPPNMGDAYEARFNPVFPELADQYDVPFYPFFLEGVAGDPSLNLDDGIHPNPEGVSIIVAGILPYVIDLLAQNGLGPADEDAPTDG